MASRRTVLRAAAGSAFLAPFWRSLAHAGGSSGPQNLLVVHSPNGTMHDHWRPVRTTGVPDFASGSILEPLQHFADRLVLVDGLDFHNATNHEGGMEAMLTNGSGGVTDGASLDQVIAAAIGGGMPLSSLELGVATDRWGGGSQTRMSYSAGHSRVTPDDDPVSVYTRMYGDLIGDEAEVAARLARRMSVLDLVREELDDLHGRLGAVERARLDQHLTALRSVEQQLTTSGTCSPGMPPDTLADSDDNFPALAALQLGLAVEALACGMSRVVTVQLSHTVSPIVPTWLGISDGHHTLSHSSDSDPDGVQKFVTAERWFSAQFAGLLEALEALDAPDGSGSMLDQTLVVWAKELGDPRAHTCIDVPFVLAGGGAFTEGRYLDCGGANHAHLLVSICQAFGLDLDTFGDEAAGSGPLGGL